MNSENKIKIVLVLGGPGCGKSTICKILSEKYGWVHIPVGEILMKEIDTGSDLGKIISEHIKSAIIIPAKITFDAFINEISKYPNITTFLVDGYPRNYENYRYLTDNLPSNINITKLLYLKCTDELMIERIEKRKQSNPNRIDNSENIVKKRITTFYEQTIPIINEYNKDGKVIVIDSTDTIDNIKNKITEIEI